MWLWLCTTTALAVSSTSSADSFYDSVPTTDEAQRRLAAAANQKPCVKWGNTFDVSLSSKNVQRPCKLADGRPICCSALQNYSKTDPFAKPVGYNYHPIPLKKDAISNTAERKEEKCSLHKVYVSSAQELRDLSYSKYISTLSADHTDPKRLDALMKYVVSAETIRNSTKWLERVRVHMADDGGLLQHYRETGGEVSDYHPDDIEFLSRFEVTRTCGSSIEKWVEWIEPLTITARHPFGFGRCRPSIPFFQDSTPRTDRSNVDYVLLQSGKALHDQSYYRNGRRVVYNNGDDAAVIKRQRYSQVKHFMLDSGTSTFDSSLFWFTCAFAQVCSY